MQSAFNVNANISVLKAAENELMTLFQLIGKTLRALIGGSANVVETLGPSGKC